MCQLTCAHISASWEISLPISISNGNGSWLLASIDTFATIGNVALLRTGIVAGAGTARSLVGIAGRAEIDQTVGCRAVVLAGSTVSLKEVNITISWRKCIVDIQHQSSSSR